MCCVDECTHKDRSTRMCICVRVYIVTHSHACAEIYKKSNSNNMVNLPVMICLSLLGFYCFSLFKGATVRLRHCPTAVAAVSQLTGNFPLQQLTYTVAQQHFKQTENYEGNEGGNPDLKGNIKHLNSQNYRVSQGCSRKGAGRVIVLNKDDFTGSYENYI